MGIKEKKATISVTVCDSCFAELDQLGTHISATAEGYMKKEHFEFDLCPDCAGKIGLHRRGRKPTSMSKEGESTMNAQAPGGKRKRGRPRKNPEPMVEEQSQSDREWEASAKAS